MRSASPPLQPISRNERIVALDVLRGFALLGILLMNIECFVGPLGEGMTGLDPTLSGIDRIADAAVYILIQGKFYTLFCLLFGMGFAVLAQRIERAGRSLAWTYLRRTVGLLVIGLMHAVFVWSGDVLVSYAVLAMALLVFNEAPSPMLPVLAVAIYLIGPAAQMLFGMWADLARHDPASAAQLQQNLADSAAQVARTLHDERAAFGVGGSYVAATVQRLHELREMFGTLVFNVPSMLGMFVLGSWFVRSGAIAAPERFPRLFAGLRWGAWPLGLAIMLVSFRIEPWMDPARLDFRLTLASALASLSGLLMSLGYMAWGLRWWQPLRWLAPAGRMALTNYLMQSVICTGIFYGYGLGYFERLSRAWQLPFALALFALQVMISHLWLARFRFGPLEWLWRWFTYLRRPVMRRDADGTA